MNISELSSKQIKAEYKKRLMRIRSDYALSVLKFLIDNKESSHTMIEIAKDIGGTQVKVNSSFKMLRASYGCDISSVGKTDRQHKYKLIGFYKITGSNTPVRQLKKKQHTLTAEAIAHINRDRLLNSVFCPS